jgi:hypothetical protein
MSLVDIMIDQLGAARKHLEDGQEVLPAWRISTPEGAFLVSIRLDQDDPAHRERAFLLISRFMKWKLATSFVFTSEIWLGSTPKHGSEEGILAVGVSRQERIGLIQRIRNRDPLHLTNPEWLSAGQIDEFFSTLLPSRTSEITIEEIAELSAIFGDGGEMQVEMLS